MIRTVRLVLTGLVVSLLPLQAADARVENFLTKLTWTGQAGIRIKSGITVHIDPYKLARPEPADLILITHSHRDHYSTADIDKIKKSGTIVVVPKDLAQCGITADVRVMEPGQVLEIKGIKVGAVPSYNTNKPNHPQANKWLGYLLEIDGVRIYHAGDTDIIPEMGDLQGVDIALLPVGGTYTMDPAEAAEAARVIRAGVTIPVHNLSPETLEKFKDLYPGARILSVEG